MTKLGEWLDGELKRRSWSHRELARRIEMSQTAVSEAINGKRGIGLDFCIAVGAVLGEPPENVLRLAGLLPPLPPDDSTTAEIVSLLKNLPTEDRRDILDYTRLRYNRREARAHPFRMEPQTSLGPLFDFMPPAPPANLPAGTAERVQAAMEELSPEQRAALMLDLLQRREFVEALRRRGVEIQRRRKPPTAEIPAANSQPVTK